MSSLRVRLERLENRSTPPGDGASAARRGLAKKFEDAIAAREMQGLPNPPATLREQSLIGLGATTVALAIKGHPAEGEARRVLSERLAARGRSGVALEKLVEGYIDAIRRQLGNFFP